MRALCVAVAAASFGCVGATAGRATPPVPIGPTLAEVRTSETDGLRVLWNGGRYGPIDEEAAWLAASPDELIAVWRQARLDAPVPRVDFSRYVVVSFVTNDGPCGAEIVGAVSDGRTVRLLGIPTPFACEDSRVGIAQIVAFPRRIMPRQAIVVGFGEWGPRPQQYAFDVPPPSPPNGPAVSPGPGRLAPAIVPSVDTPMQSSGFVEAPPAGHIALEALADGTEVWVAHRADDSISVLSATLVGDMGLTKPVDWWPQSHRLGGDWDSHGWSVQGFAPLPGYAFRRQGSRIEVLPRRGPDEEGLIEARDAAPVLDGPAHPYALLPLTASWNDVPEGRVARLDVSLVFGVDGQPRLCKRSDFLVDHHFRGCPQSSPRWPVRSGWAHGSSSPARPSSGDAATWPTWPSWSTGTRGTRRCRLLRDATR